ncbi:MAG: hypothetical protein M3011_01425 [Actinomycetota bacterium]|nr:hypothetical protein [Actinomycetota bacterium]
MSTSIGSWPPKASGAAPLNVFDLVLAFGCGWGRAVVRDGGRWEVAYPAMINQVGASLVASNRLLANQFPQFALTSDDLLELPGDFAVSLLGSCDCGHHRRECRVPAGPRLRPALRRGDLSYAGVCAPCGCGDPTPDPAQLAHPPRA